MAKQKRKVDFGNFRQVSSPQTRAMLAPLGRQCTRAQLDPALTDREWPRLARLMEKHRGVPLRVYVGYGGTITDTEFLPPIAQSDPRPPQRRVADQPAERFRRQPRRRSDLVLRLPSLGGFVEF